MWLLPFENISLDYRIPPEELLTALKSRTRPRETMGALALSRRPETATFVGEVSKERLEFRLTTRGRDSFAPFLIGRIVQGPAGARIEGVLRPHTAALVFAGLWLLAGAPIGLLGIKQLVQQGAAAGQVAWIPVIVWSAMYPICMLGFLAGARRMRRKLGEIGSANRSGAAITRHGA